MKQGLILFLSASLLLLSCGQGKQKSSEGGNNNIASGDKGKQLFMDNCQRCHALKQDKMGPKLEGAISRWDDDTDHVVAFIKNSQQVINGGNAYAARLYGKWDNTMMPPFNNLSDADIKAILAYIDKGVE